MSEYMDPLGYTSFAHEIMAFCDRLAPMYLLPAFGRSGFDCKGLFGLIVSIRWNSWGVLTGIVGVAGTSEDFEASEWLELHSHPEPTQTHPSTSPFVASCNALNTCGTICRPCVYFGSQTFIHCERIGPQKNSHSYSSCSPNNLS